MTIFNDNYCRLLPSYLKQTVNEWTKGQNYLNAIELPNPPGNIIKIKHPKNPAKSITLHYSQGNYIELTNICTRQKIRLLLCLRFTSKILHTFI
jgi:hypothetical protein